MNAVDLRTSFDSESSALKELCCFLESRDSDAAEDLPVRMFEHKLWDLLAAVGRTATAKELARYDVDAPIVLIDGVAHRRAVRSRKEFMTRGGIVAVERTLYRKGRGSPSVAVMDLQAGIVAGYWTEAAAALGTWATAHMTADEAEEWFRRSRAMAPSKSSLHRLQQRMFEAVEGDLDRLYSQLREPPPVEAVSVAVSLDGVMLPMREGDGKHKRDEAIRRGKTGSGPTGFREASCGTVSFYDARGDRLRTDYFARMPEPGKIATRNWLTNALKQTCAVRPDLAVVAVADGAHGNWRYFDSVLSKEAVQVVDFFHAAEHLKEALDSVYGAANPKARRRFDRYRDILRDHLHGVGKVIDHLRYLRRHHPRKKILARELRYFRTHRRRMHYAVVAKQALPIGSGVVEAANKMLVTVRMKRSGARWTPHGGQGILLFRALAKSKQFDTAWEHIQAARVQDIEMPAGVTPIR